MKKWNLTLRNALIGAAALGFTFGPGVFDAFAANPDQPIKVLYTNDVHCGVDDYIGYAGLAQYKKEMKKETPYFSLVDAGDAIQGAPIGILSNGAYLVDIMNYVGYDVAVPGNHEFDYGMQRFLRLSKSQKSGYVSCNFVTLADGRPVFSPYKIIKYGPAKVAYVGVTTPESLTKSTPKYFIGPDGNYIYGFSEDESGQALYDAIQQSVNDARAQDVDFVVLVGHLGEDGSTERWSGAQVIAHTTGIDALIDGHSHETIQGATLKNANGENVILTQTGTKLQNIGVLTIGTDGSISAELVDHISAPASEKTYTTAANETLGQISAKELGAYENWTSILMANEGNAELNAVGAIGGDTRLPAGTHVAIPSVVINKKGNAQDPDTVNYIRSIEKQFEDKLGEVYASTSFPLLAKDENGNWLVRNGETGLTDLCADAFRVIGESDIGMINGGGIRTNIAAGAITYNDLLSVFPYNNMGCVIEATGQQILDALEQGARSYPQSNGGLLHTSGLSYSINSSIPSSVVVDDKNNFIRVAGAYRVQDVMVGDEPLDLSKTYTVSSINYILINGGDGKTMFEGCKVIRTDFMPDVDVLKAYFQRLGGSIPESYASSAGRLTIK